LLRNPHPFNLEGNALTISASAKRDHVFPDMIRDLIANTLRSVLQDILNEIIAVDIRADIDQCDARTTRFFLHDL